MTDLQTEYAGRRAGLFWLGVKTSLLTSLTLGIYRFWMKTRLRRWYWSAIRPGGVPLEYIGTGTEKLIGFFIAIMVLAVFFGLLNVLLAFTSLSLGVEGAFFFLVYLFLIPIFFFARYRARRYILARTRWRGLRFGLESGAWGYVRRAIGYSLLTIVSLGLLVPLQMFALEKYLTDRTWFGDARFIQTGRWTILLRSAGHYYTGWGLCVGPLVLSLVDPRFLMLVPIGVIWIFLGAVHLSVDGFRVLTNHKVLGAGVRFDARPRTGRVLSIYIWGSVLLWLAISAASTVFSLVGLVLYLVLTRFGIGGAVNEKAIADALQQPFDAAHAGTLLFIGLAVIAYLGLLLLFSVLQQVFFTLPKMRHYAETLVLHNVEGLDGINQRARDEFAEAEGFADALNFGAAI